MKLCLTLFLTFVAFLVAVQTNYAQAGDHILYGDLLIDESHVEGVRPLTFDVLLYTETGVLVARQATANNGRFRFNNLPLGIYQLAIEVESVEAARVRVELTSPILKDVRRDITLEWRSSTPATKAGLLSAADSYTRSAGNQKLFVSATAASQKKQYAKAAKLLQAIVSADPKDFPAWAALANVHFLQRNWSLAENEYLHSIDTHPGFFLALFNFGRLELTLKKYDVAAEALARAVKLRPESPDVNYFLGESYLRLKKGSLAVPYLNEAVRLDPVGMAEVHLRLAALYHAAGLRQKAAAEYEAFLKKRPEYVERRKLEKYIAENRRTST